MNPIKGEESPSLEAWTLAAGIAEATDRITISHTTLSEAFRYPTILAKQAVTMAEEADGWLVGKTPLDEVKDRIEDMNSRLEKKGRDRIEFAVPALVFVRGSDREAEEHVKNLAGENEKAVSRALNTGLVGSPETIAGKIRMLQDVGINHLLLHFTPTFPEFERFTDEILPLITN